MCPPCDNQACYITIMSSSMLSTRASWGTLRSWQRCARYCCVLYFMKILFHWIGTVTSLITWHSYCNRSSLHYWGVTHTQSNCIVSLRFFGKVTSTSFSWGLSRCSGPDGILERKKTNPEPQLDLAGFMCLEDLYTLVLWSVMSFFSFNQYPNLTMWLCTSSISRTTTKRLLHKTSNMASRGRVTSPHDRLRVTSWPTKQRQTLSYFGHIKILDTNAESWG